MIAASLRPTAHAASCAPSASTTIRTAPAAWRSASTAARRPAATLGARHNIFAATTSIASMAIASRSFARRQPSSRTRWSRSEEHTSELQSLMRISYAVFCLKKKKQKIKNRYVTTNKYDPQNTQNTQHEDKQNLMK